MSKLIQLTQGYAAVVDDADYEQVSAFKWCALVIRRKDGTVRNVYAKRTKEAILLHRLLLNITDPKIEVDHIDHDGLNCQRSNMRPATHTENAHNSRSHKGSTSRFLGVSFDRNRGKWVAQIKRGGKNKVFGRFNTEEEAYAARQAAY